jgi:hypothetical protein
VLPISLRRGPKSGRWIRIRRNVSNRSFANTTRALLAPRELSKSGSKPVCRAGTSCAELGIAARFLRSLAGRHFSARAAFHKLPHGRDDAGHDACHEGDTKQPQSSFTDVLVRDVHGTPNGFHRCLPNELVVGGNHLKHGMMTVRKRDQLPFGHNVNSKRC